jgi:hypothetical protein
MYKKETYYVVLGGASLLIIDWLKNRVFEIFLTGNSDSPKVSKSN